MITAIKIDSAIMESLDKMVATVKNMDPSFFKRTHKHKNDVHHGKGSKHKKRKSHRGDNNDRKHHGKEKHREKNRKAVLVKKLKSVKGKIAKADFEKAIDKLNNDVMKRFDGCAVKGDIDRNDWVRDCSAQESIYPIGVLTRDLLRLLVK